MKSAETFKNVEALIWSVKGFKKGLKIREKKLVMENVKKKSWNYFIRVSRVF